MKDEIETFDFLNRYPRLLRESKGTVIVFSGEHQCKDEYAR